jgi:hypothetical protein
MVPEPIIRPELIGLASPADKGDLQLSLFLYNIREHENRRTEMINSGSGALKYPPMALDLHYLLTAYSNADLHSKMIDEHRIMGKALQLLHDFSVLRGSVLQGTLAQQSEELRLVMDNIPSETMINYWNFNDVPFKMSVSFRVSPVLIDSTRSKNAPLVRDREFRIQG